MTYFVNYFFTVENKDKYRRTDGNRYISLGLRPRVSGRSLVFTTSSAAFTKKRHRAAGLAITEHYICECR